MECHDEDLPVLNYIQRLVDEEHLMHQRGETKRLAAIQVQIDQCWDLLRQRRALRDVGLDPDHAVVRTAAVVENYE